MADTTPPLLSLPSKVLLKILRILPTRDNLSLAATCSALHGRIWDEAMVYNAFAEITLKDYGAPLMGHADYDPDGAESFFYFLRCVRGILRKLYLPTGFLALVTTGLLQKFPVMELTEIYVVAEEDALFRLANSVFTRIPSVKTVTLKCKEFPEKKASGTNVALIFATMGSHSPRIERFNLIGWERVAFDDENCMTIEGIGPKIEKVLVRKFLRRLRRITALNFRDTYLTSDTVRNILELPNVRSNLEEFRSSKLADTVALRNLNQCAKLRFVHRSFGTPVSNDVFQSLNGLTHLEHVHFVTTTPGHDPLFTGIIADQSRTLKRVFLDFNGVDNTTDNVVKKLITNHPTLEVMVLNDTMDELTDASLPGLENLSKLRVIAFRSFALTGAFLNRLGPDSHPSLRLVLVGTNVDDDSMFFELQQRLKTQNALVMRWALPSTWSNVGSASADDANNLEDNIFAAKRRLCEVAGRLCPYDLCCLEFFNSDHVD